MKKMLVTTLALVCSTAVLANGKSIPSEYQGCWSGKNGAFHQITKSTIETPSDVDYIEENVISVTTSAKFKGGIKVKTDYDNVYNFKLGSDKKSLQVDDFGRQYKKISCHN